MQTRKHRVLCADDHEDTCFLLSTLLGSARCEVTTAGGVAEVKRAVSGGRFDLAVLDNRFADGAGVELCRWVKGRSPQTPVVFYSGAAFESDRDEGLRAGAAAYVIKPDIEGLLDAVNRLLRGEEGGARSAAGKLTAGGAGRAEQCSPNGKKGDVGPGVVG